MIQAWRFWPELLVGIKILLFIRRAASDYYELDDLLTPEEKGLRHNIREIVVDEVAPIMAEVNIHIHTYAARSMNLQF